MKVCSEKGFTGIDISVSVIVIFIFISIISLLVYRINSTSQEIQLKSDARYVAINEIENCDILIEIETENDNRELNSIDKLKEKISELQIPVDTNDYFIKKAEIELKKFL